MISRLSQFLLLIFVLSSNTWANENRISFAVGHDHDKMLASNYPIYRANWEFIQQSLGLMGYLVHANISPWARAKYLTQVAEVDGLFLAANFKGRDQWANFSQPLGYGIFGSFYHKDRADKKAIIANVRLGAYDKVLSKFLSSDLIEVSTAQKGFHLLFNQRVDRFVMSESYGNYLLDTELSQYKGTLLFDESNIEKRTIHIAFSKKHKRSREALAIVNQAIELGLEQGLYTKAMERNKVPMRMRLGN